jgi:hypothetical protein
MIAAYIAGHCTEHDAPAWPAPFRGSWKVIEDDIRADTGSLDAQSRLIAFGEFRYAVTQAELLAAASVATLMHAWRDLLDIGKTDHPQLPALCERLRQHLRSAFGLRLSAPPLTKHIGQVSRRSTRRFDLLPPEMREVMP